MAKAEPSNKTKSTASSLKSGVNPKSSPADSQLNNPKEILGAIYGLMVKNREQTIRTRELEQNLQESKKKQEDNQHSEILKALTVRRKPKRVIRREKKAEEKVAKKEPEPTKAPEKKPAETKKPPGKKPEPTKAPEKKPAETKKVEEKAKTEGEKAKKTAEKEGEKAKQTAEKESKAAKDKAEKEAEAAKKKAEPVKEKPAKAPKKVEPAPKAPPSTPAVSTAAKVITGAVAVTAAISGREALAANISKYESGDKGYNAYNRGDYFLAKKNEGAYLKSNNIDFSKMTIADYLKRTNKKLKAGGELDASDPNVLFAVGKYQLIPGTMKVMAEKLKFDANKTYLTPDVQDMLFAKGLTTKGNGGRFAVDDYINGKEGATRDAAILALAMEFASVGVPYDIKAKSLFKNTLPHVDLKKGETFYKKPGGFNAAHNSPEAVGVALDIDKASKLKSKTTTVPSTTNTGNQVDQLSQQNEGLKDQAARDKAAGINVINQSTNVQQSSQTPTPQPKVDDRPAILRK